MPQNSSHNSGATFPTRSGLGPGLCLTTALSCPPGTGSRGHLRASITVVSMSMFTADFKKLCLPYASLTWHHDRLEYYYLFIQKTDPTEVIIIKDY